MFNNLGNLADLMRNAGKIRESVEKATEALGQLEVDGTAGGGVVSARANGKMELLSVRIDPKLLADGDAELLEDLVTAAVNQALTRARESAAAIDQFDRRWPADPRLLRDVRARFRGGLIDGGDRRRRGSSDRRLRPASRPGGEIGRTARLSSSQGTGRGGPRSGRGDPGRQGKRPLLRGLLPSHRGRPATLRSLPRPTARSRGHLRGRADVAISSHWRNPGPSAAFITSSSAGLPRLKALVPTS